MKRSPIPSAALAALIFVIQGLAANAAVHTCDGKEATIVGTLGNDTIRGGDGDDVIVGLGGNDWIYAGAGDDTICADGSSGLAAGEGGNDVLFGDGAAEGDGGPGDDVIKSFSTALGREGDDVLHAETYRANVSYWGGPGSDILEGSDYLGPEGQLDELYGEDGDDVLRGRGNRDYLFPGSGSDIVDGGPGSDLVSYVDSPVPMEIDLSEGIARARLGDSTDPLFLDQIHSVRDVDGSAHADLIRGDDACNLLEGCSGVDLIEGLVGNDMLVGWGECLDEPLWALPSKDILDGGVGYDICISTEPKIESNCES